MRPPCDSPIPGASPPSPLSLPDPEGPTHELVGAEPPDEPLVASHPDVPSELALQGFDGVRAFAREPDRDASRGFLEQTLGFTPHAANEWEARGETRGGIYAYDVPPEERGIPGAGTVHHVAWSSPMEDHAAGRQRIAEAGARPTPIIDRFWFKSIYSREPSGVLFEIATLGPGFTTDEPLEHLGETIVLPPFLESKREQIEAVLTPLPGSRAAQAGARP